MPVLKKNILILLVLLFSIPVKSQSVFKTPSGAKFHLASCSMVKNVSEQMTASAAKEWGLQPCRVCQPENTNRLITVVHKAQGQSKKVQCTGLTKAGVPCKHMTKIANEYCFQRQPK